jgi:hypothetical protein
LQSLCRNPQELSIASLSVPEIVFCCVVMMLSYALRGSTGFGAAVAMPVMALVIPLKILIPGWTIIGLTAGLTILGRDRKLIAWRALLAVLPSSIVGFAVGLYLFVRLDPRTLTRGLGIMILAYGFYSLWLTRRPRPDAHGPVKLIAALSGLFAGAVGTTFGTMASVFYAIYFDAIRMAKENFRATMSAVLVALGGLRGIGFLVVGQFTGEVMLFVAMALPMMLIGIFIGDRVHSRLSELAFRRTVSVLLIVSGAALLWK